MGYSPWSRKESDTTERLSTLIYFTYGNICFCVTLSTHSTLSWTL